MIALDPSQRFEVSLDVQARMAEKSVFSCRFPTSRQLAEIDRLTDEVGKTGDSKSLCLEALGLVDTKYTPATGVPLVFSLDIDADKDGPMFTARLLSADELKQADAILAGEEAEKNPTKKNALLVSGVSLVGIVGVDDATQGELREIVAKCIVLNRLAAAKSLQDLSAEELFVACLKVMHGSQLTENERKKSALRSAAAAARKSGI